MTADRDHVTNIISTYLSATDDEVANGMEWYPNVNSKIVSMGIDPWLGAGIFAAYSINTPWYRNWDMAIGTLLANEPRTDTLGISIKYACDILLGADPREVYAKSAPKLSAFTAAIADPANSTIAVIDRHARNLAVRDNAKKSGVSKGEFYRVAAAYSEAAYLADIPVHAMQAITWVTWRRQKGLLWHG